MRNHNREIAAWRLKALELESEGSQFKPTLGAHPGLGTQPYKAPGDLQVELVKKAVINNGLVRLSPWEWPKIGHGTAKLQFKKSLKNARI